MSNTDEPKFYFEHVLEDVYMAQIHRNMLIEDGNVQSKSINGTKIICTIGPVTQSVEQITSLVKAGMNVARLNFSHGDYDYHSTTIKNINTVRLQTKRIVSILLDTQGPEIRTLYNKDNIDIELKKNNTIIVSSDQSIKNTDKKIALTYKNFISVIDIGHDILIDDGLIALKVIKIDHDNKEVICNIENGGILGSRKGVNLPGALVDLPNVTENDINAIKFGIEQGIDFIAASFIRNANGIIEIKNLCNSLGEKGKNVKIIAKLKINKV